MYSRGMNTFENGQKVIVIDGEGNEYHGIVRLRNGALPYEAYDVLAFTGEKETVHVNRMRPLMSDTGTAQNIVRALQNIDGFRAAIKRELEYVEYQMKLDGQPDYELDTVRSLITMNRESMRFQLSSLLGNWSDYVVERKRARKSRS